METSEALAALRRPAGTTTIRSALATPLRAAFIFVLALVPRALTHGTFVTVDEAYHWFGRAEKFLHAFQKGDYAGTNLIGHPGVTTMWLGASGVLAHRFVAQMGWGLLSNATLHRELLRLPVAVVTSLIIALAYPLLRRLFGQRVAWLTVLLWATDPFIIAHSQLLHTDALLTSFMTLALLAALVAFRFDDNEQPIRWSFLVASAISAGLALLTKSPSILLLPLVGLIALVHSWRRPKLIERLPVVPILVWTAVTLAVWFALWPALWVNLIGTVHSVYTQVSADGGSPHAWGNFFLGRAVADPGLLFYPVAMALRLTPWTLIGLVAMAVVALRRGLGKPGGSLRNWRALGLLALFALLFVICMSVLPKKFDRYVLPVFPTLDLLAAVGLLGLIEMIGRRWEAPARRVAAGALWTLALVIPLANVFWFHPYEISYYNQILGGGRVASRLIPIGWGEGYEQAGAFISAQYDGCDYPVATWFGPNIIPFVCSNVTPLDWTLLPAKHVGYAVLYIDQMQRDDVPQVTALLRQKPPLYTVHIHGIDYAYVYRILPPITHPTSADFGPSIHLDGYDLDTSALRTSGILTATLHWTAHTTVFGDFNLFVHALDTQGKHVGQVDLPLVGPHTPPGPKAPDRVISWSEPIPIQASAISGPFWLSLGVYTPTDFKRLPLGGASTPSGAPDDGGDALKLGPFPLP